ncbi:hypothetical protein E8E13_003335 [Curvularia kusanoi]|uniref:Helicase C-terminal domain-containing protein n=1 Tax=Curvularia kusanoi TaxID=90978 RepID=A0A9P4W9C4_CURKU|nr:hypothetical protein E8E13_003335 [Curvularia kusanoi]
MEALMDDVLLDFANTKSIVFTCWTRTLDLIEIYLKKNGLTAHNYQRIDGDCTTSRREKILDRFSKDFENRILIMTTGTGAVGLNLAIANRVFIVEPQWNPSVENQAIARALRIGQKQPVHVTRYILHDSVEQELLGVQEKKKEKANLVNG